MEETLINGLFSDVEEEALFEREMEEEIDWLHLTHNPEYEYEGCSGEDDVMEDCFGFGFSIHSLEEDEL